MEKPLEKAADIQLIVFDVDGVLTSGSLIMGETGEACKIFHVHDGMGFVMLREAGIDIAIISARTSQIVSERMVALGVKHVYQGEDNKRETITKLMRKLKLKKEQVAYVGDDLIDLPAMRACGFSVAVNNAHPLVKEHADWTTNKGGGQGAAREVCELVLHAQGKLHDLHQRYLGD